MAREGKWSALLLMLLSAGAALREVATESTTTEDAPAGGGGAAGGRPDVYSLRVESRINHRYARTVVSSRLANKADRAQEARFSLVLPESAFISAFLIETEGKVYDAYVKEKEEAKKTYDAAVAQGQTAGTVAVSARDANTFDVAVNVAPGQKVTFNLTYEELLRRRLSTYTHTVHLNPHQEVQDLRIDVYVEEERNLTAVHPPAFLPPGSAKSGGDDDDNAAAGSDENAGPTAGLSLERPSPKSAHVVFAPTRDQQRSIAKHLRDQAEDYIPDSEGLSGRLVVKYDVERDPVGGEVLVDQGYFVHFFAPDDKPPLPKHIVFTLDVSGSMGGRKIDQLKQAMITILNDLNPGDYFNIIEFSSSVTVWNLDSTHNNVVYSPLQVEDAEQPVVPDSYPATAEYIAKAKNVVNGTSAAGGTNIYDALRMAIAVARGGLKKVKTDGPAPEPIILFLTDGQPTVGETRPSKIFSMVSESNEFPKATLFSLSFGNDADLPFLKKLSLHNSGFARKIYEAADAALQLNDFYRQVASPVLSNVTFQYTSEAVEPKTTTKTHFSTYFAGSEMVVAGRLAGDSVPLAGAVEARAKEGAASFQLPKLTILPLPPLLPIPGQPPKEDEDAPGSRKNAPSLERLWAYLSIRQLLDESDANSGFTDFDGEESDQPKESKEAAEAAKKKALQLALQYSFVTPLTSLVVVKPEGTEATDLKEASEGDNKFGVPSFISGGSVGGVANFALALGAPQPVGFSGFAPAPPAMAAFGPPGNHPTYLPQRPYLTTTFVPAATTAGHDNATTASPSTDLGKLYDLQWLTNALSGTSGWLHLPLTNGTKSFRLGLDQDNTPFEACSLPEGDVAPAGNSTAHCRHLHHCIVPEIVQDIMQYVRYFCNIGEYAGVCCPDRLFVPVR